jgi:mannitol-specific phosphotransferase system IIBC component
MRSGMERPNLLSCVIPVVAAAGAVVTVWAKHNMELTLTWACGLYAGFGASVVVAWVLQTHIAKKHEAIRENKELEREKRIRQQAREDREAERTAIALEEHEILLATKVQCQAGCAEYVQNRELWESKNGNLKGMNVLNMSALCWTKQFGKHPSEDPNAQRSFPEWKDL